MEVKSGSYKRNSKQTVENSFLRGIFFFIYGKHHIIQKALCGTDFDIY